MTTQEKIVYTLKLLDKLKELSIERSLNPDELETQKRLESNLDEYYTKL